MEHERYQQDQSLGKEVTKSLTIHHDSPATTAARTRATMNLKNIFWKSIIIYMMQKEDKKQMMIRRRMQGRGESVWLVCGNKTTNLTTTRYDLTWKKSINHKRQIRVWVCMWSQSISYEYVSAIPMLTIVLLRRFVWVWVCMSVCMRRKVQQGEGIELRRLIFLDSSCLAHAHVGWIWESLCVREERRYEIGISKFRDLDLLSFRDFEVLRFWPVLPCYEKYELENGKITVWIVIGFGGQMKSIKSVWIRELLQMIGLYVF